MNLQQFDRTVTMIGTIEYARQLLGGKEGYGYDKVINHVRQQTRVIPVRALWIYAEAAMAGRLDEALKEFSNSKQLEIINAGCQNYNDPTLLDDLKNHNKAVKQANQRRKRIWSIIIGIGILLIITLLTLMYIGII